MTPLERLQWSLAVAKSPGITGAASRLATILAGEFMNGQTGLCNPSISTLAGNLNLTDRAIQKAIGLLEDRGFLLAEKSRGGTRRSTNIFHFRYPQPVKDSSGVHDSSPAKLGSPTGESQFRKGRTPVHPNKGRNKGKNTGVQNRQEPPAIELFQSFWAKYPRRQAKKDAYKAWRKLNPDENLFGEVMAGLETAIASPAWKKDNGQYIPLPASWINGERWLDELAPPGNADPAEPTYGEGGI